MYMFTTFLMEIPSFLTNSASLWNNVNIFCFEELLMFVVVE